MRAKDQLTARILPVRRFPWEKNADGPMEKTLDASKNMKVTQSSYQVLT